MKVLLSLLVASSLALSLSACTAKPPSGSPAPETASSHAVRPGLAPETEMFLQDLSKIKTASRDKVVLPYTSAAQIGSQYFSPKVLPPERKKRAIEVLGMLKQPRLELTQCETQLSHLKCPPDCAELKKHFSAYLAALAQELEFTRQYAELFLKENPAEDPRLKALSDKLSAAAAGRSAENDFFQQEIRRLTSASPAP